MPDLPPELLPDSHPQGEAEGHPRPPRQLPPLPFRVRVGVFLVGWVLILVGVAGLVLPGIQGVLTIVTGAALLSLDNELIYRLLRSVLARWPTIWAKVERLRHRIHDKLHRFFHRG